MTHFERTGIPGRPGSDGGSRYHGREQDVPQSEASSDDLLAQAISGSEVENYVDSAQSVDSTYHGSLWSVVCTYPDGTVSFKIDRNGNVSKFRSTLMGGTNTAIEQGIYGEDWYRQDDNLQTDASEVSTAGSYGSGSGNGEIRSDYANEPRRSRKGASTRQSNRVTSGDCTCFLISPTPGNIYGKCPIHDSA